MEMEKLQTGHSYLIKSYELVKKITVDDVTKTCYQYHYENRDKEWKEFNVFESEFILIEDLGEITGISDLKNNYSLKDYEEFMSQYPEFFTDSFPDNITVY